jgi:hypothetical protein
MTTQEEQRRAELLYFAMLKDQALQDIMDASNKVSVGDGQVEHGWPHALDVGGPEGLTWYISDRINALIPGRISRHDQILAGAGGLVHDSGRSVAVKDHDKHSARLAHHYLRDLSQRQFGGLDFLPNKFRARVVQLARKHRADSWLYHNDAEKALRKKEIDGADMALLLLSDKLCGSESRVPTPARMSWGHQDEIEANPAYTPAFIAAVTAVLKKRHIEIPATAELDHHDQVNGSIKDRVIEIFADEHEDHPDSKIWGTMLYRLTVNEGIATQELVTGLDWWHEAFHVSAKAAKFLGLRFRIEFNGRILAYDKSAKNWVRVDARHA